MQKNAFFAYWDNVDPNMLETCIASLRRVSDCVIHVATNEIPKEVESRFEQYQVYWLRTPNSQVKKRRATCKIEVLQDLFEVLEYNSSVLVADVDIVFIKDPFTPFWTYRDMDLGLTTRGYAHAFPINGGVFYLRRNKTMLNWLQWHLDEIYKPRWEPYVLHRKKWNHVRYGLDWSVGQDFLVANWKHRDYLKEKINLTIVDVGPEFNYCPPTDTMGSQAFQLAWDALEKQSVAVLHLKSELKRMIYDSRFPNPKLNFKRGRMAWL